MKRDLVPSLAVLTASLFAALALAEFAARRLLPDPLPFAQDERNLSYRYDSQLGWFPVEGGHSFNQATRRISVQNNQLGFRDHEYGPKDKPRIAFLGDSYVWGFDVEQHERFTEKLQARVPGWEVLNNGVSGYGTDQEYLLVINHFAALRPDIVFLLFSENDHIDNRANVRYEGYFKPYFVFEDGRLYERGIPVPKSINYYAVEYPTLFDSRFFRAAFDAFERQYSPDMVLNPDVSLPLVQAVRTYVEGQGAAFMLALVHREPAFEAELQRASIAYVNVSNDFRYRDFGGHWTPEGHDFVAEKIYQAWRQPGRH